MSWRREKPRTRWWLSLESVSLLQRRERKQTSGSNPRRKERKREHDGLKKDAKSQGRLDLSLQSYE